MKEQVLDEPGSCRDESEQLSRYLDFYRGVVLGKLAGLTDAQLRSSILPSGWSPLELLKHLVFMERRWFRWGLAGETVADPWGDGEVRWVLTEADTLASLTAALDAVAAHTRATLAAVDLNAPALPGGRFADDPPNGRWICLHVLQEYARHTGHLDVVRELTDEQVGEVPGRPD